MCESSVGCLVECTNDARCAVHGAGLSPEDLDKPQVIENGGHGALTTNWVSETDWNCPGLVGG